MNVEVFVNNSCILTIAVREEEAGKVAERLYDEFKIGILQLVGVSANVYISGVRSKMDGPVITELLK